MHHCLSKIIIIMIKCKKFCILLLLIAKLIEKANSVKCYSCTFALRKCIDLNCYEHPDVCSPRYFTSAIVPTIQCADGCEIYSITDTNGLILEWRRGCDKTGNTRNRPIDFSECKTHYDLGVRYDKCICNQDYCNSIGNLHSNWIITSLITIIGLLLLTATC